MFNEGLHERMTKSINKWIDELEFSKKESYTYTNHTSYKKYIQIEAAVFIGSNLGMTSYTYTQVLKSFTFSTCQL
jgi:hypothetical protein